MSHPQSMAKTFQIVIWITMVLLPLSTTFSANYYWVGGSGNWSDITHWATTSGGTVFHNVIPSANDDVFFDSNSFTGPNQEIKVENQIIFSKSLNWTDVTNQPIFSSLNGASLNIYGSLILSPDMTFDFTGSLNFRSESTGNTIQTAGHTIAGQVVFDGIGGGWMQVGPITTESFFQIKNGDYRTQDFDLEVWSLQVLNSFFIKEVDFGSSLLTVTGTTSGDFKNVVYLENYNQQIKNSTATLFLTGENPYIRYYANQELAFDALKMVNSDGTLTYEGVQDLEEEKLVFKESKLDKNSLFLSNLDLGSCTVSEGKTIYFNGGSKYYFNTITTLGVCTGPIELLSNDASVAALFYFSGTNHQVDYTSIGGIHIQSGAPVDATNAANLFNNDGWNFVNESVIPLYWVGGTGNWNDPANWSFTSNGPGGACIPKGNNLVIFDEFSFSASGQTATVNVLNPSCAGMIWRNLLVKPIFQSSRKPTLKIYGDLKLHANMVYDFQGDIILLSGSKDASVTTANHWLLNDVYIDNPNGDYHLKDSLKIIDTLFLNAGGLFTEGETVLLNSFLSNTTSTRRLNLSSSTINIEDYGSPYLIWEKLSFRHENLELDAGTSHIIINYGGFQQYGAANGVVFHNLTFNGNGNIYVESNDIYYNRLTFFNNGYINARVRSDSLLIEGGFEYQIYNGFQLNTRIFLPNTSCAAYSEIIADEYFSGSTFTITEPDTFSYLILKKINRGGSQPVFLRSSFNLENSSQGWTFLDENKGRTLYWVGDAGNWQDENHWALTSGGTPGQCPPTLLDTAIFDEKSFSVPNQHVSTINYAMQQNVRVLDIQELDESQTSFNFNNLNIYGSITMADSLLDFYSYIIRMKGTGDNEEIALAADGCIYLELVNEGQWTLTAPLVVEFIDFYEGQLYTNHQNMELLSIHFNSDAFKKIDLTSSNIILKGHTYRNEFYYFGDSLYLLSSGSIIECTASYPVLNYELNQLNHRIDMGHVIFSSIEGTGTINGPQNSQRLKFNRIDFRGNGRTELGFQVDSLFFASGKKYNLAASDTLVINDYWQTIGNNCTPIELASTITGVQSYVQMASGIINANYVQMKDQKALGQIPFLAGSYSTDISNNDQWSFESRPGFESVGFLGEDQFICQDSTLNLNAFNNSPGESYLWSDGSNLPTLAVNQAGTYTARVTFANNCTVTDSILVFDQQSFEDFLPNDTLFCQGDEVIIDGTVPNYSTRYLWSTGDTVPIITYTEEGQIKLTVSIGACAFKDSINLNFVDVSQLQIEGDSVFCQGDSLVLSVAGEAIAAGYQTAWEFENQSDIQTKITIGSPGSVILNGSYNGCATADTLEVVELLLPVVGGPFDLVGCEGDTLSLDAFLTDASYLWAQNGSVDPSISVWAPGQYSVEVEKDGCYNYFDYEVEFLEIPVFTLQEADPLCEGESLTLNIGVTADRYQWSNGSSGPSTVVNYPGGNLTASAFNQNCAFEQTINVEYIDLPSVELGESATICQDETYVIDVTGLAERVEWMDGTTSPVLEINQEGWIAITAFNDRCSMMDSVYITQERCYPFNSFLPNAISPNGDGINDVFLPLFPPTLLIQKYSLQIYDRWGMMVFETVDPNQTWDGSKKGQSLPIDTYIFHLSLDYQDDYESGSYQTSGTINIIR